MATTLEQIAQFLSEEGLQHRVDRERNAVFVGFRTVQYRDESGEPSLLVVIKLLEDGEYIEIFSPMCYCYKDGPHKEVVFQACLMVSYATKHLQFEYDPGDGEIRAVIEFPLEDAPLTKRQLLRCVHGLVQIVDKYDPMIRGAMTNGEIKQPPSESAEELLRLFREFLEERRRAASSRNLDLEE
ncbi:MAG: hypothetical protein ACOYX1_03025 [Acidobacteriota bacterium]